MQTFDVSVNVLNDKLLFSSAGAKGGVQAKKDRAEAQVSPEAQPKAPAAKCAGTNAALFIGVVQLVVFSVVVSSQTSSPPVSLWTLAGSVILLVVPVLAFLALPSPRCAYNVQALWSVLFVHDIAICMLMHASPLIVIIATVATACVAKVVTRFADHAWGT